MTAPSTEPPKVVSRAEWLEARKALLAQEKQMTRKLDQVRGARRRLPWVRLDKVYAFDGPGGQRSLAP